MLLRIGALALTIFAGALAGCGGGGSSIPHAGGASQGLADATLRIVIPQKTAANGARRPAYISPSTTQLVWSLDGVSQTAVGLTSTSPGCSGSGSSLTCTVNFYVAPGTHTFSFTLEDASNKPLSAVTSVSSTLVAGQANNLDITLGGIAQSFSVTSSNTNFATPSSGAPFYTMYGNNTVTLTINALDADGNIIVGSGTPAVTATLTSVPSASPVPATLAAGSGNTWTLSSSYAPSNPTLAGAGALVVAASPVPSSGPTTTLSGTFNVQFFVPWLYVAQNGSGKVTSYNEQGTAQSVTITGLNAPVGVAFGANTSTASPLPSPYLYVATVTTATPVPTPVGTNTVGPSTGAVVAYNGDGSTPTLTGSFSGAGLTAGLAFDTNLNDVYVLNSASLLAYDAQGNAVSISSPTISSPTGIVFDGTNHDLYVSTTTAIFAYLEGGGGDTAVSSFNSLNSPSGVAYDSNLNELAVLNKGNSTVALYAPSGGGALTSFGVIASPVAIVYDPYVHWFYVANATSIAAYSESGALQTTSFPALSAPVSITVVQ